MSRLYVLTHEIIELEDYEKVPDDGTEILIVESRCSAVAHSRIQYTDDDVKEVQRGLYPATPNPQAESK
jgi:hypothetical protein